MPTSIHGILPIVYTPFDAHGEIDEEDVRSLVDYLLDAGAHGLAAVGGASECHKLSISERKSLAELVIDQTGDRAPVVVGISAINAVDTVELAVHAENAGAVGVFATPPLFGKFDYPALKHFYGALAGAVGIPTIVQDAENPIAPDHIIRLGAEIEGVTHVKEEAPDSGHRITTLLEQSDLTVLSGGSFLLDDLARGAVGAIPGSVGIADLSRAYNAYREGDHASARAAFDHFLPLSHWRRQFPLLGSKEVLRRIGVIKAAHMRQPPGQRLDEHDHRELTAIMEAMGPPY